MLGRGREEVRRDEVGGVSYFTNLWPSGIS